MNQIAKPETLPMTTVGFTSGNTGSKIAPQNLGEVVKFAEVMSRADIALPKHLRGNAGACMAVAMQALEWEMSPFAVASKSYQVNGAIAYEAQLIVAVVNTRSGIEGRLKYAFEGEGDSRVCICTGKLDGEVLEVRSPKFKDITPKNSPLWKSDPDQQQCYYTGRTWARRHTPEVILGVYDREEAATFQGPDNAKDVTPSIMDRFKPAQDQAEQPQNTREGFDADFVRSETQSFSTGNSEPEPETPDPDPASSPVSEQPGENSPPVFSPGANSPDRNLLIRVFGALYAAAGPDREVVEAQSDMFADEFKTANKITQAKATTILKQIQMLGAGEIEEGECIEYLAGVIGVEPAELMEGTDA